RGGANAPHKIAFTTLSRTVGESDSSSSTSLHPTSNSPAAVHRQPPETEPAALSWLPGRARSTLAGNAGVGRQERRGGSESRQAERRVVGPAVPVREHL